VAGHCKNLIFAANGPKPELVLADAINNDIRITKNEDFCLVYDPPIGIDGLRRKDLVDWWAARSPADDPERTLYRLNSNKGTKCEIGLYLRPSLSVRSSIFVLFHVLALNYEHLRLSAISDPPQTSLCISPSMT
jgi:hypothetical protein